MKALGTLLKIGTAPTQKTVGEVTNIAGIEISADTIETTTMGSTDGYREYEQGLKDGGNVELEGIMAFDDQGQSELLTLVNSGDSTAFEIAFPNNVAKWAFNGVVVGFGTEADMEGNITFTASIKVSGKPTLTIGT